MINFNDQLHEEMFTLFICYANSMSFNERKYSLPISQSEMIALQCIVEREYLLDFSNRNIHEEQHEYKELVEAIGNIAYVKNSEIALIAKKYAKLEAENARLREALEFYANEMNYSVDDYCGISGQMRTRCILYTDLEERNDVYRFAGRRARKALEKSE